MDQTRRTMMGLAAGWAASGFVTEALAADAPSLEGHPRIARVWHGRTPAAKADEYRQYLFDAGVKKIASLPGNRGCQMMSAKTDDGGEFMVISYWDSIEAIKGYAGPNYTKVHDLPRDKDFLIDPETLVRHFDLAVDFRQS